MTQQHTPTPWKVIKDSETPHIASEQGKKWDNPVICLFYEDVTPEDSVTIGNWYKQLDNNEVNAAFIVTACNNHEALVEKLKNLLAAYESQMHNEYDYPGNPWTPKRDNDGPCLEAHAVLAALEGK